MQEFRDVLHNYQLFDFGFKGLSHTYDNKREGRNNVKVRLDRAVADDNWRNFFTDYQVSHLISPCSDHCPILLKFDTESQSQHKTKCLRILGKRSSTTGSNKFSLGRFRGKTESGRHKESSWQSNESPAFLEQGQVHKRRS